MVIAYVGLGPQHDCAARQPGDERSWTGSETRQQGTKNDCCGDYGLPATDISIREY